MDNESVVRRAIALQMIQMANTIPQNRENLRFANIAPVFVEARFRRLAKQTEIVDNDNGRRRKRLTNMLNLFDQGAVFLSSARIPRAPVSVQEKHRVLFDGGKEKSQFDTTISPDKGDFVSRIARDGALVKVFGQFNGVEVVEDRF